MLKPPSFEDYQYGSDRYNFTPLGSQVFYKAYNYAEANKAFITKTFNEDHTEITYKVNELKVIFKKISEECNVQKVSIIYNNFLLEENEYTFNLRFEDSILTALYNDLEDWEAENTSIAYEKFLNLPLEGEDKAEVYPKIKRPQEDSKTEEENA